MAIHIPNYLHRAKEAMPGFSVIEMMHLKKSERKCM
jgi:hypothetical protein